MLSDLRFAVRSLLKAPLFTIVVIATIALGIAANTAIFSVVHAVLLAPPPFSEPERLAVVWETDRNTGTTREPGSWPDFQDIQRQSRTMAAMGGFIADEMNLSPGQGDPRRVPVLHASHELIPLLGIKPIAGRVFTPAEDAKSGPAVALISDALWQREFRRDPGAIGRTLRLDDTPWTIVGVMPPEADFGILQVLTSAAYGRAFADRGERAQVDIWLPLQGDAAQLPRSTHPLLMIGRLAPTATIGAAQAEIGAIAANLEKSFPDNAARGTNVESLTRVIFGPVRPALYVLLATVALVLIVACVNVANLLLARGDTRAHEVAVRRALGAGSATLLRLFVTESAVLTATASAIGVGLAFLGVRAIVALAPADVPRLDAAAVDPSVLAVTAGVSIVVAFLFGIIPSIHLERFSAQDPLKDATVRASASRGSGRLQQGLVVAELALALLLVCSAGLLIKSFWRLQAVDPGFQSHGVLKAEFQLPPARYPVDFRRWPDFREQHAFDRALLARAEALPGVESAAIAGNHPLDPGFTNSFAVVGREAESRTWPEISVRRVTSGYFRTVGLALVRGRLIEPGDTTTSAPVILINETAAQRFFGKTRSARPSGPLLGNVTHDRRRRGERAIPWPGRIRSHRRVHTVVADAVRKRRRRAARSHQRRSGRARRLRAIDDSCGRSRACGVRAGAAGRDALAIGLATSVHHDAARGVRGDWLAARRYRHPRDARAIALRGGARKSGFAWRSAPDRERSCGSSFAMAPC